MSRIIEISERLINSRKELYFDATKSKFCEFLKANPGRINFYFISQESELNVKGNLITQNEFETNFEILWKYYVNIHFLGIHLIRIFGLDLFGNFTV